VLVHELQRAPEHRGRPAGDFGISMLKHNEVWLPMATCPETSLWLPAAPAMIG
jgi:hypothetical protein